MKTRHLNKNFRTILKSSILMLAALPVALSGCSRENESDRAVASALACLDVATDATSADACVQKVEGIETSQAYLIRCSADFIAQGLTGTRLATAFQQQKNPASGGSNQTVAMAAYLVFSPSITAHTAEITVDNCNKSGVPSVIGLSAMVSVATTIATMTGSLPTNLDPSNPGSFDPEALKQSVSNLLQNAQNNPNDPTVVAQETAIGQAALSAQTAYCGAGSSLSTQDVCTKLNAAISTSSGDAANIGFTLLQQLNQ